MSEQAIEDTARTQIEAESRVAEEIAEIDTTKKVFGAEVGYAGESSGVVLGPLLGIGKDRVGFRDLLELALGIR